VSSRADTGQLAARNRLAAVGRARDNLAAWQPSVQRLADLVVAAAGVPVSVVSLVTADSQIMLGCAGGGASATGPFEIPLSASLCREVVITGLPFIARDTAAEHRFAGTEPVLVHGIRAYAGFPVADEDGLILGVVSVAMHEPHDWTVAQLSTVDNAAQLFAELLSSANVAAVQDVTDLRRVERFRRCEVGIARAVAEAPDPAATGQAVLTAVTEALGWPYSELWQYDPAAGAMRPAARCHRDGFGPTPPVPPRLAPGAGLPGRAWSAPGPVWVCDVDRAGLLAQDPAAAVVLRSAVVVPVCGGEDCAAALVLCSGAVEQPDDLLSVLLSGVAAQFGQHLQRRRAEGLELQLARSRHEYVRLVGHELRTPLTSIAACTDLLSAFGDDLPGDARELLDAVTRNSDRLRHIINALLDIAALDSGQVELQRTGFDLAGAVRHAVAGPFERDVQVRCDTPDTLVVEADETRIRQVLRTLIDNAVTYSHPGGQVTVTLTGTADTACLTVADTGIGIPPDELDEVFERFQRSSRARHLGIPGLGLGLAASRAVLEHHQGTVTLRETPGGGITAEACLPLRRP
jgi:signal transduction histidine kinase